MLPVIALRLWGMIGIDFFSYVKCFCDVIILFEFLKCIFAKVKCRLAVCHVAVSNGFHKTVFTSCALQNYKNNYELPKSSSLVFVSVFV